MKEDTFNYKGWLISDRILKRSLAIVGHNFIGVIIIYGIMAIIAGVIMFIAYLFTV